MYTQEFCDLITGCDEAHLADFLGITLSTLRNWKSGRPRNPEAAYKLLRIKLGGDLSALAGCDWQGFRIGQDC